VTTEAEQWNHNIHYHQLFLDSIPAGARAERAFSFLRNRSP
jgi:hypothetical protein